MGVYVPRLEVGKLSPALKDKQVISTLGAYLELLNQNEQNT